jgi:Cys-tRNA(Pro) deacylase
LSETEKVGGSDLDRWRSAAGLLRLETIVEQRTGPAATRCGGAIDPSCRLPAVPDSPLHPAVQRVIDAAAKKGVTLDIHHFPEGTHTAEDAARAVGSEIGQIVKSLIFVAPSGAGLKPIVCLVSGPNRVDLGRLAAVTGEPDVRRATAAEAKELTGYTIGGIPPIGHGSSVRIIMDPDLGRFQTIWAAAGTSTAVFPVKPQALLMLANAHVAPICEERRQADVLAERAGLAAAPPAAPDA